MIVVWCTCINSFYVNCYVEVHPPTKKWQQEKRTKKTEVSSVACWLERHTCDRKVASLNPGRNGRRILFSIVNFVFWLLFNVCSTPVLPQWHVNDCDHSAKSAGGRLHLNTHTSLTQRSRSGLTMPQSRHSVGIYQETSSHATPQGTLGHSRFSSLSRCGLILAKRVKIGVRDLIST